MSRVPALFLLLLLASSVSAQDSFGNAPQAPARTDSTTRIPAASDYAPAPTTYAASPPPVTGEPLRAPSRAPESEDFGVHAQDALRPTESLHAPTPMSVPGARTIDTRGLSLLMRDPERHPLLFHVLGSAEHLPGAVAATPAGQGGSFDDAAQREFGQFLQRMSRGDASVPMVFYCGGTHCWMSYNAALRAVHLGYRNVAWYRGGIEAWRNAGLPIEGAEAPNAEPVGSAHAPLAAEPAAMQPRPRTPTP